MTGHDAAGRRRRGDLPSRLARNGANIAMSALICFTSGCASIQSNDAPPQISLAKNFARPAAGGKMGAELQDGWWRALRNSDFANLAERAMAQSASIDEAQSRLDAAAAARNAVGEEFRPQFSIANRAREDESTSRAPIAAQGLGVAGADQPWRQRSTIYTYGGDAAWELDLFGRGEMRARSAGADVDAARFDLAAAKLSVASELLRAYVNLGVSEDEHRALARAIDARRQTLDLVRARSRGGLASDLDVTRAEAELRRLEQRIPVADAEIAGQRAAIGALLGEAAPYAGAAPRVDLALFRFASIPSDVLRRRPDVRNAAANIIREAAGRDLAEADLYPRLTINGDLTLGRGLSGNAISSLAGALGPTLQIPLFDRDLRLARLSARERSLEATAHAYRDRVVTAAGEVWRGLAELRQARKRIAAARAARASAGHAETLAGQLFRSGMIDLTERLLTQVTATDADLDALAAQRAEAAAVVALIKATAPVASN